jgi:hypothetical protein
VFPEVNVFLLQVKQMFILLLSLILDHLWCRRNIMVMRV